MNAQKLKAQVEEVAGQIEACLTQEEKACGVLVWSGACDCGKVQYRKFVTPAKILVSNVFHRQKDTSCQFEEGHEVAIYCATGLYSEGRFVGTIKGSSFEPAHVCSKCGKYFKMGSRTEDEYICEKCSMIIVMSTPVMRKKLRCIH